MNFHEKSPAAAAAAANRASLYLKLPQPASSATANRMASRVCHARRRLLRDFVFEQLGDIVNAAHLALVYHAANDDFAVAYLAKCIAAHGRALDANVADISAINRGDP